MQGSSDTCGSASYISLSDGFLGFGLYDKVSNFTFLNVTPCVCTAIARETADNVRKYFSLLLGYECMALLSLSFSPLEAVSTRRPLAREYRYCSVHQSSPCCCLVFYGC